MVCTVRTDRRRAILHKKQAIVLLQPQKKKKDGKLRNTLWIAGKNEIRALYCKYVLGVNIVDFFFFFTIETAFKFLYIV